MFFDRLDWDAATVPTNVLLQTLIDMCRFINQLNATIWCIMATVRGGRSVLLHTLNVSTTTSQLSYVYLVFVCALNLFNWWIRIKFCLDEITSQRDLLAMYEKNLALYMSSAPPENDNRRKMSVDETAMEAAGNNGNKVTWLLVLILIGSLVLESYSDSTTCMTNIVWLANAVLNTGCKWGGGV